MSELKLVEAISESGIKKSAIAGKLGITLTSFNNKLAGRTGFYVDEAIELMTILGRDERDFYSFFARKVE